jgi:lipoyl(octanoyl) transferase
MNVENLGLLDYRTAWARQEKAHAAVLAGGQPWILFVEHPPVITFGRRDGGERHLLASDEQLQKLGVEIVKSDRGGDITFHGPGQLVAYPILRLNDFRLSVGAYVHRLEDAVIATLAELKIPAQKNSAAVGVWVDDGGEPAKICAIGVRISRGVTLHGLALNVTNDLGHFDLIVPCGLPGKRVTSLQKLLGNRTPAMNDLRNRLAACLVAALTGVSPPRRSRPELDSIPNDDYK